MPANTQTHEQATRGPIHVLDPRLASKIAAGEVIERPSSVLKELIENALDAGSQHIRVEIEAGGVGKLSVADDGVGIPASQVELAFRRHATSKLNVEDDLDHLLTLGFRGEALPSIAAVADVTCTTRTVEESVGTELRIEAGERIKHAVPRQPGTTMTVEHLFERFPARRKFLKSRTVETAACLQIATALALAFPEVHLTVVVDGREALRTSGDDNLQNALVSVLGGKAAQHLVQVAETIAEGLDDVPEPVVRVAGVCGTGSFHRSDRNGLHVFVNRRPVQNRALTYAVLDAYGSLVPIGRHPVAVLNVTVPTHEVDFNVHPSKLEVKLLREGAVFATIKRAIGSALSNDTWRVASWRQPGTAVPSGGWGATSSYQYQAHRGPENPWRAGQGVLGSGEWRAVLDAQAASVGSPTAPWSHQVHEQATAFEVSSGDELAGLRVLGQAGSLYVVAEGRAGIYLVDQHAAHERVRLEELRSALSEQAERQVLMEPLVVTVSPEAAQAVERSIAELARLGFEVEPFGPGEMLVRTVPARLSASRPERVLAEAVDAVASGAHDLVAIDPRTTWTERLALVLACKTAVRAGDTLSQGEMEALLRKLGEAELCRTCAHGRPTAILLDYPQLERQFGRR